MIIVSKVMNNDAGIIIKSRLDKLNAYTSNIYTGTEPVKFFSEMFKQDDVNGRTREILDKKKELLTILRKQFFFNYLKDVNGFNVNNSFDEAVKTIMRHIMIYNDEETRLNYKFGFYICAYWLFLNMREIMTPNHNRAIKNTNLLIVLERIISNFAKYIDNTREYQNFLDEMGTEKMKEQKSLWSIGEGKTINVKASKITDFTTPSPSSKTPSPSTKSSSKTPSQKTPSPIPPPRTNMFERQPYGNGYLINVTNVDPRDAKKFKKRSKINDVMIGDMVIYENNPYQIMEKKAGKVKIGYYPFETVSEISYADGDSEKFFQIQFRNNKGVHYVRTTSKLKRYIPRISLSSSPSSKLRF